ncbi:MAG: hypothetical protein WC471_02055 [Candidatus Woesearchaeota archaeon]
MNFNINITNKIAYLAIGILTLLIVAGLGIAYTSAVPIPGHGADTVLVSVSGTEMTLQQAIDQQKIGGGLTCITQEYKCTTTTECASVKTSGHAIATCPSGYTVTGGSCYMKYSTGQDTIWTTDNGYITLNGMDCQTGFTPNTVTIPYANVVARCCK